MWTTPAGVCAALFGRGATVCFGCPGLTGVTCREEGYSLLFDARVSGIPRYYLRMRSIGFSPLLTKRLCSRVMIQRCRLTEREAALWCFGPYYRYMRPFLPMRLWKDDYVHLQGNCRSVTHIFITMVPYHTGQLTGKSCMYSFPSLSSLTDKLVNCMCGIGSGLVVWMSVPEVYCGRFNKCMFPKFIKSVKRIAVPHIKCHINKSNNDKLTSR